MDKVVFFRIQSPPNRKIREIFKTFEKNFSATSGCRTRCSKPLPFQPPAPGEFFLSFSWDKMYIKKRSPVRGLAYDWQEIDRALYKLRKNAVDRFANRPINGGWYCVPIYFLRSLCYHTREYLFWRGFSFIAFHIGRKTNELRCNHHRCRSRRHLCSL